MFLEQKCTYNKHILCGHPGSCVGCGWEPREEARRKANIRSGCMTLDPDGLLRLHVRRLDEPEHD